MYTLIYMATLQKKNSRGHTYWQIVESRRVNGKPRPVVLAHLGTADRLLQRLQNAPGKPLKARVIEFGALAALWNIAQELDLVGTIDRQVSKRVQGLACGHYMLLACLNRCVAATSKASLYDWYRDTVLQRLLPTSKRSLSSQRFWDHMSYLDEENSWRAFMRLCVKNAPLCANCEPSCNAAKSQTRGERLYGRIAEKASRRDHIRPVHI